MLRGPEDTGCAHCTKPGAERACRICTRIVCEACANDWTTCAQPAARVLRLGLGARLEAVDPSGTFAFVVQWPRAPRVVDLRTFTALPRTLPRHIRAARLTRDERLLYVEEFTDENLFRGVIERVLRTGQERTIFDEQARRPYRGAAISASEDVYYFISESQEVIQVAPNGDVHASEPLPKKALQAVFVDRARGLVAAASWSEVALTRLDGDRISHMRTRYEGDVAWLALGGRRLAVAVRRGPGARIEILVADEHGIGRVERELAIDPFHNAALSRDGRYLAVASKNLVVVDLDTDEEQNFAEHTDTIRFVAFGADDHRLISADDDNRLIIRPRTPAGYAEPIVEVELQAHDATVRTTKPCAHCEARGTEVLCIVCKLPVCVTCSGEWTTCREPAGVEVRLGMSARVRDVDAAGQVAVVTHWRKPPRRFDIRHLTFLSGDPAEVSAPRTSVTTDLKLRVTWSDGRAEILDPVPRQPILAHAIDVERHLVAVAVWGRICVHDGTREVASYRVDGATEWIGMAAGRIVAVASTVLHAWVGNEPVHMIDVYGKLGALSRDGRYVALAHGVVLDVYDIEISRRTRLSGHTDEINLVRFADDGMLISADTDNRLLLRPRGPTGYSAMPPVPIG